MKRLLLAGCVLMALNAPLPAAAERHRIVVQTAPPALRIEHAPAHRRGHAWAAGHWRWTGHRYVWSRGHWVRARAGYGWASPGWDQRDGRYYYRSGRWERRGG